jgi:shikimate dehydrogenase
MQVINGKSKVLGIIGHPVGHSLSPVMQNAALGACQLNYVYVPFDVHPDNLASAIMGLRSLGVVGFNVTIPHKSSIIPFLDSLDVSAQSASAVNTVKNEEGRLVGYNTDGDGLVRSLAEDLDFLPGDGDIVVIGAGGAARGAIASLCRAGTGRIIVFNRTPANAFEMVENLGLGRTDTEILIAADELELKFYMKKAQLLINTTSVGMNHEMLPFVELADLPDNAKIYDMVYAPAVTPLLHQAGEIGLRAANGLGMLAGQGELAFQIWTGILPPSGLMKSCLVSICAS